MTNRSVSARVARRLFLACALVAPAVLQLRAQSQDEIVRLEPFVVTATRTPAQTQTLGTVVDAISWADLEREQIGSFKNALGSTSAPVFASGQTGAISSVFLRGANSNQTLFLVDGIRLNDPNTDYNFFLGGSQLLPGDTLEIAHGPQSTLYGGEAIGGVVSLQTQKGASGPGVQEAVEAGSFGTVQGMFVAQDAPNAWAYNIAASGEHTDNSRSNNSFDGGNVAVRLDRTLTTKFSTGATLRGFSGRFGDPGDRFTNDPNNFERENNWLGTIFFEAKPVENFSSHLILGGQDRRFVSVNPEPNPPFFGPSQTTVVVNRRGVIDWQNTVLLPASNRLTAGLTAEANTTRNTGFGDIDKRQKLFAFFAEDEWSPIKNVFLTGGLRHDNFDTYGGATTGRATAAWLAVPKTLKLRASYGTGFRSPSFLDLYGTASGYQGNPNLKPEHARGWDGGLDYYLPQKRGTLSATYFETDFTNLITTDFSVSPATTENVGRARTRGVEFSAKTTLPGAIELRLAYTYLDAIDQSNNVRLVRRPRHLLNGDAWHDFGGGFSAGAGLQIVAGREDIDAQTFAQIDAEDYTVVRLYAAWQATRQLTLKVRLENLLDEKYEEVNGYPALGFGAFGGVEYRF